MADQRLNVLLSRQVAQRIEARPQHCARNAYMALPHLPGAVYVEGFCVFGNGQVITHCWVERDGEIIDPTLADDPPGAYFVAITLTDNDIAAIFAHAGGLVAPPLWKQRPDSWQNAARAERLAHEHFKQDIG